MDSGLIFCRCIKLHFIHWWWQNLLDLCGCQSCTSQPCSVQALRILDEFYIHHALEPRRTETAPGEGHWPAFWGWAIALGRRQELLGLALGFSSGSWLCPPDTLLHWCAVAEALVSYCLAGGVSWSQGPAASWWLALSHPLRMPSCLLAGFVQTRAL